MVKIQGVIFDYGNVISLPQDEQSRIVFSELPFFGRIECSLRNSYNEEVDNAIINFNCE